MFADAPWDMGVDAPVAGDETASVTQRRLNMDLDMGSPVPVRMGVGPGLEGIVGVWGSWERSDTESPISSAFLSSVASSRMRPITRRTTLPMTCSVPAAWASLRPVLETFASSWSTLYHLDLATTWSSIWAVALAISSPWTWRRFRRLPNHVRI